ncbi:hypothetical protein VP01_4531g2, partial [Puccinia sorghi]
AINNIGVLVRCTNIVASKTIMREDYITKPSLRTPHSSATKVVPLMALSEFPGERLIGLLQK